MLPGFLSGPRGHCGRTEGDRARARGEAVRAELAVGGPQDADALHPQVSSSVTLSEVVFQLGRMVDCERSGRNVTCRVGNLSAAPGPGESATITLQAIPTRAGTIENTASVDSIENDLNSLNDSATAATQVVAAARTAAVVASRRRSSAPTAPTASPAPAGPT